MVTLEHPKRFRDGDDETPARELAAGGSVARVRALYDQIRLLYCNGACASWGVPHTFSGMDLCLTPESVEGVSDPLRRLEMVTSIVAVFSAYSPTSEFGSRVRGGGCNELVRGNVANCRTIV